MSCTNNLRQIGLAFANYHAAYERFPSPDFDAHSWRIRCLPFLISSPLYAEYRFSEPWDSPSNLSLDRRLLEAKSGDVRVFPNPYGAPCGTSALHSVAYLMFVGEHAFGAPGRWRDHAEIRDGLDSTIAVAETTRTDIHWLAPHDFDAATMSFRVNDGENSISSNHPSGPAVLFCDGEVYRLNANISPAIVEALVTIDGGEPTSRDQLVAAGDLLPP